MRFMILAQTGAAAPSPDGANDAMARYRAELARAGVLLETIGLQPGGHGWRVRFRPGERCRIMDGTAAGGPPPIAGCTLIEVRSREEALEWSRRFPLADGEIEVRQVAE